MINCPKCGAPNPDNRRSCQKCGSALSGSGAQAAGGGRRCPMCGKANPPDAVACQACGARLVPLTASGQESRPSEKPAQKEPPPPAKPRSQSRSPSPAPEPPAQPDDWLSQLRGALPTEQPESSQQPAPDEDVPDWLRSMQGTDTPSEEPAAFDIAARLGGGVPASPASPPPASEVPDWLSQLGSPSQPAPAQPPLAEADVPDWLKQMAPAPEPPLSAPVQGNVPDWLSQLSGPPAPVSQPSPPAAPAPAEAEVPDWLTQLSRTEPAAPQMPGSGEGEVPDWLAGLSESQASAPQPTPPAAPPPAEAEVPDWLSQMSADEPAAPTESAPIAGNVPDWLGQMSPAEPAAPTESASGASDVPDWLQELTPASTPAPAAAEIPDWLTHLAPTPPAEVADHEPGAQPNQVQAPASDASSELPDWLQDLGPADLTPPAQIPPVAPVFTGQEAAAAELPDWLAGASGAALSAPAPAESETAVPAEAPVPQEMAGPFEPPSAAGKSALPDWLENLKPGAPPESISAPSAPAGQLPSWLQAMAPTGRAAGGRPAAEEPVETEGILAGLRGILPAAAVAFQTPDGPGLNILHSQMAAGDLDRASAFRDLVALGPATIPQPKGEGRGQFLNVAQRLIVFALLVALVIFPLISFQGLGLVGAPTLSEQNSAVFDRIQALPPGASVLVEFDYDATQAPEMDVLARAIMRHLFARQAKIQIVSLYPAGPVAAQSVVDDVRKQMGSTITDTASLQVRNVGYIAGQSTGVALLTTASKPLSVNVQDYSTLIELAAAPDTLRWWVEQLASRPQDQRVTVLAGVSAAAEPMSRPYLESKQVAGMMSGIKDAIAYQETLRGSLPPSEQLVAGRPSAPLESLAVANAGLVVLILFGGLIYLAGQFRRNA